MAWHYNGMIADSTVYSSGNPIGTSLGFYPGGRIKDSVFYRADGSGVRYTWYNNGTLAAAGVLAADGKKTGRWKYWHDNGKFAAVELYDHDSLLEHQYFDENGQPSDTGRKDRVANFKGGSKAWLDWLKNKVIWPEKYKITGADTAVVAFSITVDESGKLTDVYVSNAAFPQFEKVALRAIRHSPKWEPAIGHNRRIPYHFRQSVVFTQTHKTTPS
jgi:TonB family protein